jgi:hypothetical protein
MTGDNQSLIWQNGEDPPFDAEFIAAAITWSFPEDCPMSAKAREDGQHVDVKYGGGTGELLVTLDKADHWIARYTFEAGPHVTEEIVSTFEEVLNFVGCAITSRFNYVERREPGTVRFRFE